MKKLLFFGVLISSFCCQIFAKVQRAVVVVSTGYEDNCGEKIAFKLAKKADAVVRSQGGSGRGHVIQKGGRYYIFLILPASIVRKNVECFLTAGMEIDIYQLFNEIDFLKEKGIETKGRLWVSSKAQIVMPYHRVLAALQEKHDTRKRYANVGTREGTGWCAADKRLQRGIRIADLMDQEHFPHILKSALTEANNIIVKVYGAKPLNYDDILKVYKEYARRLLPYVKQDVEVSINKMISSGKAVIFEGAQGTFLDATVGTYPYVSSSATTAAAICCGAGVGPSRIGHTLGVVKAYATCPSEGAPLPSLITDEAIIEKLIKATEGQSVEVYSFKEEKDFSNQDNDVKPGTLAGASKKDETIKKDPEKKKITRRFGWLDLVMVREAIWLNGIDSLAITRLDDLDDFDEILICYDYVSNGKNIDYLPPRVSDARHVTPRFMKLPGWKTSTKDAVNFSQLPEKARHYIKKIEQLCNVSVSYVSVGPESKQTILVNDLLPL